MRVSDQQLFQQMTTRIMDAVSEQSVAGQQVSSGKRVTSPWDDPAAASMIARQSQTADQYTAIAGVAQKASGELTSVDGALDQVTTSLTRAHALAVQLANDSYNATDRTNGAAEVQQLISAVVSQLNVKVGNRYVFGGTTDQSPPFSAAGAYLGDTNVRQVEIAPGVMQDASIRADQAIKGVGGGVDVLTELQNLQTALSTNNGAGVRTAVQTLGDGITQVSNTRSRVGAMMNVFDLAHATATSFANDETDTKNTLQNADIFSASTRLAAAQTALQASLSVATQQFKLSLTNYL